MTLKRDFKNHSINNGIVKLKVYYRSGRGESIISEIYDINKQLYLSGKEFEELQEKIESEYHHIVKNNDHSEITHCGHFIIEGEEVIQHHEQPVEY